MAPHAEAARLLTNHIVGGVLTASLPAVSPEPEGYERCLENGEPETPGVARRLWEHGRPYQYRFAASLEPIAYGLLAMAQRPDGDCNVQVSTLPLNAWTVEPGKTSSQCAPTVIVANRGLPVEAKRPRAAEFFAPEGYFGLSVVLLQFVPVLGRVLPELGLLLPNRKAHVHCRHVSGLTLMRIRWDGIVWQTTWDFLPPPDWPLRRWIGGATESLDSYITTDASNTISGAFERQPALTGLFIRHLPNLGDYLTDLAAALPYQQ